MQLHVLGQNYEFENNALGALQLFERIQEHISLGQYHLYGMQIDNELIYADYQVYINNHLINIQKVQAELLTLEQWGHQMIIEMKGYLHHVLQAIRPTIDALYGGGDEKTWVSFLQFVEGLEWIVSASNTLQSAELEQESIEKIYRHIKKLNPFLVDIVQSMENKDSIQLADLINYELLPILEVFSEELTGMTESGE